MVGLNVPETIAVVSGRKLGAWSSNVNVTLAMSNAPPVSDIRIVLVSPSGPTSKISMSVGS